MNANISFTIFTLREGSPMFFCHTKPKQKSNYFLFRHEQIGIFLIKKKLSLKKYKAQIIIFVISGQINDVHLYILTYKLYICFLISTYQNLSIYTSGKNKLCITKKSIKDQYQNTIY